MFKKIHTRKNIMIPCGNITDNENCLTMNNKVFKLRTKQWKSRKLKKMVDCDETLTPVDEKPKKGFTFSKTEFISLNITKINHN